MSPPNWVYIPDSIIAEDKRLQSADDWAAQQRSDLADRWADNQRALRQEHLDMIRAARRKPTIEEWRAQQPPDVQQPPDILPLQAPASPTLPAPGVEGGTVSSAVPPPALGQQAPDTPQRQSPFPAPGSLRGSFGGIFDINPPAPPAPSPEDMGPFRTPPPVSPSILDRLGQGNEWLRSNIPAYAGASDIAGRAAQKVDEGWRLLPHYLYDLTPASPRYEQRMSALSAGASPGELDAYWESLRKAEREGGAVTWAIPEGVPRQAIAAFGDIVNKMALGGPKETWQKPLPEQLDQWAHQKVDPGLEAAYGLANPAYLVPPTKGIELGRAVATGLRGLPEEAIAAGHGYEAAARAPVLRQLAPGLGIEPIETVASYASKLRAKYGSDWILKAKSLEWSKYTKLLSKQKQDIASAGKLAPAIPQAAPSVQLQWAKLGDGFYTSEGYDVWPSTYEPGKWSLGIPGKVETHGIYTTLDEAKSAAQKLHDAGQTPITAGAKAYTPAPISKTRAKLYSISSPAAELPAPITGAKPSAIPSGAKDIRDFPEVAPGWYKIPSGATVDESKVIDEAKQNPAWRSWISDSTLQVPVYHGARGGPGAEKIAKGKFGGDVRVGWHFGTLKAAHDRLETTGASGGPIGQFWLKMRNPIKTSDMGSGDISNWAVVLQHNGIISYDDFKSMFKEYRRLSPGVSYNTQFRTFLRDFLESHGYDSHEYINNIEDSGSTSYQVFRQEQIKSTSAKDFLPTPFYMQVAPSVASAVGGGTYGYTTAPEGATEEERRARAAEFGALGLGAGLGLSALGRIPEATRTVRGLATEAMRKAPTAAESLKDPYMATKVITPYDTPEVLRARELSRGIPQSYRITGPERAAERARIFKEYYGNGAQVKNKQAIIILGPPATGKSTLLTDPIAKSTGSLIIDNDPIMKYFKEYNAGLGSLVVYRESSAMAAGIIDHARQVGDNIVYPIIGTNSQYVGGTIDRLEKSGYNVHLVYMGAPIERAAQNAVKRFIDTGRFLDPAYVLNTGDRAKKTFDLLKGRVSSYAEYWNDLRGPVKLIEQYGDSPAVRTTGTTIRPPGAGLGRAGEVYRPALGDTRRGALGGPDLLSTPEQPPSSYLAGSHPAIGGAVVGGLAAPQDPNATPQENLLRRLGGAAVGAGLGYGAGRLGMESGLGGTIKDIGGLDEVLTAIKSANTPEDIQAVMRGLGTRPGKGITEARKAAVARSIELGQVTDISQKALFKKTPKKPVAPKVPPQAITPEQQKAFSEAVKPSAGNGIVGAVRDAVEAIQSPFTPAPGHPTENIINDLRTARGYLDLNKDQAVRDSHKLIKQWNSEKPENHLAFMQSIQQGTPQLTAEKQARAASYRTRFNADYQLAQQIKPDLPYRQDYFTKNGIWADERKAEEFYNNWRASLGGSPGALKKMQFPTIYDGIKAGLKLKETNPEVLYLNNHVQLLRAKMASDFFEQQTAKGADPELVKRVLDRYLDPGLQHHDAFRSLMQANFALNSLELGLSGFHVLGTGINAIASKGALGLRQLLAGHPVSAMGSFLRAPTAPVEYIMRGNKAQAAAKNANLTPDIQRIVEAGGRLQMPEEYKGTAFEQAMNDFKSGKYLQGAVGIPSAALNSISKPIMEWWVPRIKIGAGADAIENGIKLLGPGASEEAKKSAAAKAWDSIDNRFGELVQDNMFWNKTIKDLSRLAMRSPGWNIGTFREFVGGAYDVPGTVKELLKTGKLNITDRTAFAISLPITVGIISAAYQYLKTGEGPKEFIDYFYPKTGQTDPRTGKPERVVLPVYTKDIFSFVHDPFQTSINKISPIGSDLMSLLENRDYYSAQIRNPQTDVSTQARQLLAHEAITHLPFSVTSGSRRISPTAEASAEGFFGINKAPGFITGGYYATKADLDKNLDPEQKKIADYVSLPSSKGGPSLRQKANLMLQPANDWTWQYLKQLNGTANPNDPLWSRSIDDIKAYIAYKSASFPQQRAKLVARYPWIVELNRQIGEEIDAGVRSSQQHSEEIKQTLPHRIQSALGVASPEPTPRDPNAPSTLTVRGLALTNAEADAYEKIKQGAEEQLIAKLNNSPIFQNLSQAQKQSVMARYLPGADKAAEDKFLSTLDKSTLRQRLQQKAAGQ